MRKLPVILLLAAAISAAAPHAAQGQTGEPRVSCSLEEPLPFDNYWVGPRFEGLYLVSAARVCAPGMIPVGYIVLYTYENCSEHDIGCGRRIEVEIQSVPLIKGHRENISMYGKATSVGGVPGNLTGTQLAVYLPETTVFLSAGDNPYSSGEQDLWYGIGRALEKGPRVFSDLTAVGIRFPSDCRGVASCEGEIVHPPGVSRLQMTVNVLGVATLILMYGLAPWLLLRRRGSQPLFRLDRRLLTLSTILVAIFGLTLYLIVSVSFWFWLPSLGAALGAFLVAGASLRPRGSYVRGTVLGGLVYLMIGLIANAVFFRPESLAEFLDPERLFWSLLDWPTLPISVFLGT